MRGHVGRPYGRAFASCHVKRRARRNRHETPSLHSVFRDIVSQLRDLISDCESKILYEYTIVSNRIKQNCNAYKNKKKNKCNR